MSDAITIFSAQTTNATSSGFRVDFPTMESQLVIKGTFNGASVTFDASDDGTNWIPLEDQMRNVITVTSAEMIPVNIEYSEQIRCTIANAGASTSLTVIVRNLRGRRI